MFSVVDHKGLTPNAILQSIRRDLTVRPYIIMGRPGPTGKTHLYNSLLELGYNVVEVSESLTIFNVIKYQDDKNHYIVDDMNGVGIIILNEILENFR